MSDLLWDDVKHWFDSVENGSTPDVILAARSVTAAPGGAPDWPEADVSLVAADPFGWDVTAR